jgi:predicted Zn-dependent protease
MRYGYAVAAMGKALNWMVYAGLLLGFGSCEKACGKAQEVTEYAAKKTLSPQMERRLGARMAGELQQQLPLLHDADVGHYVDELGHALIATAPDIPEGTEFHFQVIDAPQTINAMALPGGFIYVYSGLLRAADTEAELAAVLSHEIAHVAERHVAANVITRLGIEAVTALALGGDSQGLEHAVARFAQQGALAAYSRTAEREADRLAIRYMVKSGRDPRGYVSFFEKLAAQEGKRGLGADLLSSHPDPAARARTAQAQIQKLEAIPSADESPKFQAMKQHLSDGDR